MIKLIPESPYEIMKVFPLVLQQFKPIKKVAVFFDNENFLITDFSPENPGVNLILEDTDGNQIHFQNANCGYNGTGPNATVRILETIGINKSVAENFVFSNQGLQFEITPDGKIPYGSIKTDVLFSGGSNPSDELLVKNPSVLVDIMNREVMSFNPQYNHFTGLLRAILHMKPQTFEFYIGDKSPLAKRYRFYMDYPDEFSRRFNPNYFTQYKMSKLKHVNLILRGERFDIVSLIDLEVEMQVIEALHLFIFKESLCENKEFSTLLAKRQSNTFIKKLRKLFSVEPKALHCTFDLPQGGVKR